MVRAPESNSSALPFIRICELGGRRTRALSWASQQTIESVSFGDVLPKYAIREFRSIRVEGAMHAVASDIVQKAFVEWTKGLTGSDARISVFSRIRDIPYAVIPEISNPADGPQGLLRLMRGSCGPKHFLLGRMFEMLRVPIQYVSYPFFWNAKSVAYPPELRKLAEATPTGYHLACKARIENRWVVVDATWDRPLARVGFPVNESWDGASDTKLAVEPLDETIHENAQGRMRFLQARKSSWTGENHARTDRFTSALNDWLEDVRTSPSS